MSGASGALDETIRSAVEAQVQAKVLEALSGGEFLGRYVQAALTAPVERPKRGGGYGTERVPFLDNVFTDVIQAATKQAVAIAIEEEREAIQDTVRKAVRRQAAKFAEDLVGTLLDRAKEPYAYQFEVGIGVRTDR